MASGTHKGTIFIADDEACLRETLQDALEGAGYHVLAAGSGTQPLALDGLLSAVQGLMA